MSGLEWPQGINAQEWRDVVATMPVAVETLAAALGWTARAGEHGGTLVAPDGAELDARLDWRSRPHKRLRISVFARGDSRYEHDPKRPRAVTVSLARPLAVCAREIERRTRAHREWYVRTLTRLRTDRENRERAADLLAAMGFKVPASLVERAGDPLKGSRYVDGMRFQAIVRDDTEPTVSLALENLPAEVAQKVMALIVE